MLQMLEQQLTTADNLSIALDAQFLLTPLLSRIAIILMGHAATLRGLCEQLHSEVREDFSRAEMIRRANALNKRLMASTEDEPLV
jgi:hypothetical protein